MYKKILAGIAVCLLLNVSCSSVFAEANDGMETQQESVQEASTEDIKVSGEDIEAKNSEKNDSKEVEKKIVINLANRSLSLYENNQKVKLYLVGVGKIETPTPIGYYKITEKEENPTWIDPKDPKNIVRAGDDNPLGQRWMQFDGYYGIHGTNKPQSVGHYVSNGCVRLREADAEDLYSRVDLGTPVEIMYNRVVVEKTPERDIVYYIYPDGYNRQPLDVSMVRSWLEGYGISPFVSDDDIEKKIKAADGNPTFLGKSFGIFLDGRELQAKAVLLKGVYYLPAYSLARAAGVTIMYDDKSGLVISNYGTAPAYIKRDIVFINADDLSELLPLVGGLDAKGEYQLNSKSA